MSEILRLIRIVVQECQNTSYVNIPCQRDAFIARSFLGIDHPMIEDLDDDVALNHPGIDHPMNMNEDMAEEVNEDPHMTAGEEDEEDHKGTSEMQPLMAEMDKDINMMSSSVKYMAEDMRTMTDAMDTIKGNMIKQGMRPMKEAMKDTEEEIQGLNSMIDILISI